MDQVKVTVSGSKVSVVSPYSPEFPPRAKELGGKWRAPAWEFDARDEERVRALLMEVYGTDGRPVETVTIRYRIGTERYESKRRELWVAGRQVARRPGRDSQVILGDGVVVVEGSFPSSAGSRANPQIGGDGVVLEIRDVPASLVPAAAEIVERQAVDDEAALLAEIEELERKLEAARIRLQALRG